MQVIVVKDAPLFITHVFWYLVKAPTTPPNPPAFDIGYQAAVICKTIIYESLLNFKIYYKYPYISIKYLMIDLPQSEHSIIILSILHNRKTITD